MAKYDERKDIRLLSRIAKINEAEKTIKVARGSLIGIHSWGKIDYLIKIHGYHLLWDGVAKVSQDDDNSSNSRRNKRKQKQYE